MVKNIMKKRIEFGELKLRESAKTHILDCLSRNWITMGPKVKEFEESWKKLFNYKYAKALSSGTSADTACCMVAYDFGAKPGDEVIIPALSFIATANAVRAAGLTPKFVDVKIDTMNIDETQIESAITDKTAAIMFVNLMGKPAKMDKIQEIAKKHNLLTISDSCESYGCRYKDKFTLKYADMETSSHYVAHLCCSGEGGIVSTNSEKIDSIVESIRSHGRHGGSLYFDH